MYNTYKTNVSFCSWLLVTVTILSTSSWLKNICDGTRGDGTVNYAVWYGRWVLCTRIWRHLLCPIIVGSPFGDIASMGLKLNWFLSLCVIWYIWLGMIRFCSNAFCVHLIHGIIQCNLISAKYYPFLLSIAMSFFHSTHTMSNCCSLFIPLVLLPPVL